MLCKTSHYAFSFQDDVHKDISVYQLWRRSCFWFYLDAIYGIPRKSNLHINSIMRQNS